MSRSREFQNLSFLERFDRSHTPEPNSGCWIWTGCIDSRSYGVIWRQGKQMLAHRASWLEFRGEIGGLFVCHHCDNPLCVNPSHLFLGSHTDNMRDAKRKGRTRSNGLSGDRHWMRVRPDLIKRGADAKKSKLNIEQVHEVRNRRVAGEAPSDLAKQFNVSTDVIHRCVSGTRYGLAPLNVPSIRIARLPRGERHPGSKLTDDQRVSILTDPRPSGHLAKIYGLNPSSIARIRAKGRSAIAQEEAKERMG